MVPFRVQHNGGTPPDEAMTITMFHSTSYRSVEWKEAVRTATQIDSNDPAKDPEAEIDL